MLLPRNSTPFDDSFPNTFASAVKLAIEGKHSEAAQKLNSIPSAPIDSLDSKQTLAPALQVQVFRRDIFTCRYCGRPTVFCPLLRLVASLFPREFRYHPNWKMAECHIAFWQWTASCDHLIPVARGGSSKPENLRTACYMCNSMKQNWLIEELRWTEREVTPSAWDGLCSLYLKLAQVVPEAEAAYHRRWLRAIQQSAQVKGNR